MKIKKFHAMDKMEVRAIKYQEKREKLVHLDIIPLISHQQSTITQDGVISLCVAISISHELRLHLQCQIVMKDLDHRLSLSKYSVSV